MLVGVVVPVVLVLMPIQALLRAVLVEQENNFHLYSMIQLQ
jgi:hypothetical protein